MIGTYVVSLLLLALSGLLIDTHRRAWQRQQAQADLSESNRRFAYRQYRRRMLASATIGVVGALIGVHPVVPRQPAWMASYLAILLLLCLWILIAGMMDAAAGALQYRKERRKQLASHAKLTRELCEASEKPGANDG